MGSQSLAVKYRPKTFEDVCGQVVTTTILKQAVSKEAFKHAYLFAGASGCGKTTIARIFASEINQGVGEPIEIDAASNNGVDNVRSIIENANMRSLTGRYKIFIIDECHAITTQGWQAFLKAIEEPPEFAIFMFCTTEPTKVPNTILNRVQRYNITKITCEEVKNRLLYICKEEGYSNYELTCDLLSKVTHGCMRDAISYLEQCASFSTDLSIDNAKKVVSQLSYEPLFKMTWALQDKNAVEAINILRVISESGTDIRAFVDNYLEFSINLLKYSVCNDTRITTLPDYLATDDNPVIQHTVSRCTDSGWLNKLITTLLTIKLETKYDFNSINTISAFFIKLCNN